MLVGRTSSGNAGSLQDRTNVLQDMGEEPVVLRFRLSLCRKWNRNGVAALLAVEPEWEPSLAARVRPVS
ncbi:hypothetical protein BV53_05190 [Candidatus Synechococcus spongiarum LMB bulk15N]|uniref:Uncharacterized protein n=1 Tax=Candidatus Synechococcus spongiarum LMB bulk15N TaxID=1943583 RepID=A0A1T1D1K0_9SYNE|nr:hypothetical protein BV53_05190 [Candidatus Synechococcus spongiarum LMB bulk15N]